ncbi:hypothetical protein [cyanobacterium endosymbiont of Epithemia turgida]|uniref:hypothetical protein n=1 Tax=cyanobacterium endosymbiont of Epithemia turgida TaxID=718217 RepID=UPI0008707E2C|nr:hypothetical protein [cyanobacterium endosymbiont of Epithemia turgida]
MGVDIIIESREFCRFPQQAFVLPSQKLCSHTYLIATGLIATAYIPLIPPIISLSEVSFQAQKPFL